MQQKTRATAQKSSTQGEPSPAQKSHDKGSPAPSSPLVLDTLVLTGDKTTDSEIIQSKHAGRKFRNMAMMKRLIALNSSRKKAYLKSFFCGNTIKEKGRTRAERRENSEGRGNYITYYCGCRHCIICSNRRTVDLIRAYEGATDNFAVPAFATFTVPAVRADQLPQTIAHMIVTFQKIKERFEKRYKRKQQGWRLRGIRVLECNHNLIFNTYNPHFHVLGEYAALVAFEKAWLSEYAAVHIYPDAQKVEIAREGTMLELFKYCTKIAVQEKKDGKISVDPAGLDTVFRAFEKVRTVQAFGIKQATKAKQEKKEYTEQELQEIEENTVLWQWHYCDWYHHSTGEPLTWNEPTEKDINFVNAFAK